MGITEEESNFLKFYFLNLKIASKAVRVYFDSVHPPAGLAGELIKGSVTLKGLRFMTKLQLNILYPNPCQTVTSAEFDTTLIVCLLRNLSPRESAPITGWDNLPHPNDNSTGADLARVKWYRNLSVHSKDGILSSTDFNQWWGDLEGAIGRLSATGGLPMLNEVQLAKHAVLDGSLIDMLLELRNCKKSQQELTEKINIHQSSIDILMSNKEEKEKNIHQVNVSHQKGEPETQKLSTEPSVYKDECTEKLETCKNDIKKNEVIIKELRDQSDKKQNKIADLILHICKLETKYEQHDKMLKEHDEHLAMLDGQGSKQGEQIAHQAEQLAQHCEQMAQKSEQMAQQGEQMVQQREQMVQQCEQIAQQEDTRALIEVDVREGTFVSTKAVTDGLLLLKQNGVLLITGYAGTGKSRIGRHVLHMFCTENKLLKCIKLTLAEWDNMTKKNENMDKRADNLVLLLDDIFGETNCIYNREKDTPILDKVHAFVCEGNIKVIVTIRDTVKRQCQEIFDSHRLFQYDFIDLSSDKYLLSRLEKSSILTKYMKKVYKSDFIESKGYVDCNGDLILEYDEVWNITRENPVKGFPLVVYQFVHNNKYFKLGSKFFDRPTEAMLEEMNAIRRKGENQKNFMIQYAVMVYTAINENCIHPEDKTCDKEILNIIDAIYGEKIKKKKCHILDAVKDLKDSYLVNVPNQRSYKLHHPTLQESVILSFAQIDDENINKIIPLISLSFFLKMVKPESYKEKEGEVVLRFPSYSYKLLADRLLDFCIENRENCEFRRFIQNLCNTEIFQHGYSIILPCLLEAFENKDDEDKYTDNMISSDKMDIFNNYQLQMKIKDTFLPNLLNTLAELEKQLDIYYSVLKTLQTLIKSSSNHLTIDYMKYSLISSLYAICSAKDVRCVKATFDIIVENKIPVLLDQGIILTKIPDITFISVFEKHYDKGTCVFLTLCIWKAYEVCNIPVLEFLLSKYNQTPFDINSFFTMIYRDEWIQNVIRSSRKRVLSFSFEPLKWMIETCKDQELNDPNFFLRFACKYQMFDTVEYVASGYKTFDEISCLQAFVDGNDRSYTQIPYNPELFNFLITKIDISSKELIPIVKSLIRKVDVPDYMFDAFLPVCLNDAKILTLACENGQFYLVKLKIDSSHIEQLDIQSALMAACKESEIQNYRDEAHVDIEKLRIVKYLLEINGFEQFDLKAVCQQACSFKKFNIIKWFLQNIDTSRLDVYAIINSTLDNKGSDILECLMQKIKIECLDKREVLKSVTGHYTAECSTSILKIVRSIWDSTEDKEVLQMEEIVYKAYERKCFELLIWIHENCHPYISIDEKEVLMLACKDNRFDVAKWVLQTFEQVSLHIDGETLFMEACSIRNYRYRSKRNNIIQEHQIEMVKWILANFEIKESDIIPVVLKLVNRSSNLVIFILEKYFSCLKTQDIKEMMNEFLEQKQYLLVNWLLQKRGSCSLDKQMILNKACTDSEIETLRILSKYFYALDINQAMINTCNSAYSFKRAYLNNKTYHTYPFKLEYLNNKAIACLDLLWKEIDHDNIDIRTIVSTFCKQNNISNNVMTWILLNIPLDQISINEVLITCCQQSKIHHVNYIVHAVAYEKLDIKEAFVQACLAATVEGKFVSTYYELNIGSNVYDFAVMSNDEPNFIMIIDYLFQKLHDKDSYVPLVVNELIEKKKFNLILYFRQAGYCRHINMKNVLTEACRYGQGKLVQWILENVEHDELDINSAFHEACNGIKHGNMYVLEEQGNRLMCLALLWHYKHDIPMFEIDTVLKSMTESQSDMSRDSLKIWLLYIKKIKRRMCQSDKALLNTEETIHQQSEQIKVDNVV